MKFIFAYWLIGGTIFAFLIPPFQKPDETVHFQKTLAVSQGMFGCPASHRLKVSGQFKDLVQDKKLQSIIAKKHRKINLSSWLKQIVFTKYDRLQTTIKIKSVCNLPAHSYLPYVPGLLVSRFFNLNQYFSFFLGRFLGFLFFFVWSIVLIKHSSIISQKIILLTFSLPMTIHQLTSYSYDGSQIISSLTIFVSVINVFHAKIKNKKMWIVIAVLLTLLTIFSRPRIKVADPVGLDPDRQLNFLINNPGFFIILIFRSTFAHFIFYLQGLLGIFGWLEYGLPKFQYFVYLGIIGYLIFSVKTDKKSINKLLLIVLSSFIFAGYLFILTLNYLRWTPYKASIIEGVQGRYFILLFPFMIYCLINLKNLYLPKLLIKVKPPLWSMVILAFILLISTLRVILLRFYTF